MNETIQRKTYYVVARETAGYFSRKGKTYKYLCRPKMDSERWSWSRHMIRAARFYDATQAESYADSYKGAEPVRISDGI